MAIGLIKVWLLAEIVMAGVYLGAWQRLRLLDPAAAAPPIAEYLPGLELGYLLLFLAAVGASWRWWHLTRPRQDRLISLLILSYSVLSMLSIALWAMADTAGRMAALYVLDAGLCLFGLAPGLTIIAFMRRPSA